MKDLIKLTKERLKLAHGFYKLGYYKKMLYNFTIADHYIDILLTAYDYDFIDYETEYAVDIYTELRKVCDELKVTL